MRSEWMCGVQRGWGQWRYDGRVTLQCEDDLGPSNLSWSYFWSCMLSCSALYCGLFYPDCFSPFYVLPTPVLYIHGESLPALDSTGAQSSA